MKKLMTITAVLALSLATNAASLSWVVAGVNLPESTTTANGVAAYMFLTAASDNVLGYVDGSSLTTVDAVVSAIKGGTFDGKGAFVSSTLNASGATTAATGISKFTAGDSLSAFAIIFDNADISKAENFMIAQNASGTEVLSASWTSSVGAQALAWGNQTVNGTTWQAIPEPTSGLLMLVGLAGLALRRRRA